MKHAKTTFNNFRASFDQIPITKLLIRWTIFVVPLSVIVGSLVALFLWMLEWVTAFRWQHLWMIFFLPLAGIVISYVYKKFGKNAEAGNNLIMDEIHKPGGGVPARMTPFVLGATIITHLFGGSAGREGTAVQMGGSMASLLSRWFGFNRQEQRIFLMCGMAAGFGAVFGTPVTGAVFALEVLAIGHIKYEALIPCLIASVLADIVCSLYGVHHTHYTIHFIHSLQPFFSIKTFDFLLLAKVICAGVSFGLVGFFFAELSHTIKAKTRQFITEPLLAPVAGGFLVIGISLMLGTYDYLGLGVTNPSGGVSIVSAFSGGGAGYWSWFWKLLLTAITLSTGFKGGEVTPLFFIGATLGNALASWLGAPADLFAGLGFIAVFAGATNTPLACTIMGVELFGADNVLFYAVACFTAYYFSGHSGIYLSQRVAVSKLHHSQKETMTLKDIKASRKKDNS